MFVELNIDKSIKEKDQIKHISVKPFTKSHRLFSFNNNNLNVYFTKKFNSEHCSYVLLFLFEYVCTFLILACERDFYFGGDI